MNFQHLQSIVVSQKCVFDIRTTTESLAVAPLRTKPYIEPNFTKVEFETEKPPVLLISAVGATGKSALAQVLSSQSRLPLLDLTRHKPVGDNTLTGLLTNSFAIEQLSAVFQAVASGQYGVLVDGVDEGRAKTNDKAFEAFLDDIARLCHGATSTSFVLFGRTKALEDCWYYFIDKGISTGLLTIDPFDLSQARAYIDKFTDGSNSAQAAEYRAARDAILDKLSAAFGAAQEDREGHFLSFIGYPPVLDAIVTLLDEEQNYHRLRERFGGTASSNVEIEVLHEIATYILDRERTDKVIANIVRPLIAALPADDRKAITASVFSTEEQCRRLVAHCMGEPLSLASIAEPVINKQYEEQLAKFLPEHPFLTDEGFRNAIFEAVALAVLIGSEKFSNHELALHYIDAHRHSYYLVYLLERIARGGEVPILCLRALLGAALEFNATNASIELRVEGPDLDYSISSVGSPDLVDIQIELTMGAGEEAPKTFYFHSALSAGTSVDLGHRLSSAYISLPCEVNLGGFSEVELTAPIEVSAATVSLECSVLTLKAQGGARDKHILFEAENIKSSVTNVTAVGVEFRIAVESRGGLHFPLIQYVQTREKLPQDASLRNKYLRLRKILTHFRSHSKSALAKYRDKIENERVAGNVMGRAILDRLLKDSVLRLEGKLYFLQPERVHEHLGISWPELRNGQTSTKLLQYLGSIEV